MSTQGLNRELLSLKNDTWWIGLAFTSIILTSIFSSSTVAPTIVGDAIVLVSYLIFASLAIVQGSTRIRIRQSQAILLAVLLLLLLINLVRVPRGTSITGSPIVRVPLLFTVAIFNLYYVPEVVREFRAMSVLAVIAAAIVLVGLPSIIVGPYRIGSATFMPYTDFGLPLVSERVPALTSFYSDSNAVSKLAMYGSFASLYLLACKDNHVNRSLFAVTVLGLYLGHSRGAMLSFLVGIGVVGIYVLTGRRFGQVATFVIVVGSILGFGLLSGILPRPTVVAEIPLSSRGIVWRAAMERIAERPVFGYGLVDPSSLIAPALGSELRGLSPQNAYLYVVLAAGVIGGAAYLLFMTCALLSAPRDMEPSDVVLVGFCMALFILGFFETVPLFGLNQSSIVISIVFGYLLKAGRP